MGKKGTKRKTKWRALPLGEEAGGSGNEEELHDEDQSTTSSVVGPTAISYKPQTAYYKAGEKPFRQNRRFSYERFKSKEPLVKLESKTFDEEEYTKITTPRQDVLFKKGYFGRKRESSVEESTHQVGEMEGEEPMMDQIIITNGFVDERGHYLVNGNSYEIYDPYSNTVTVVVGPPPYANGVTQPVLAAVSCQPVPLQPVDWYPPASDWPSQGSAWTPSYPRTPQPESMASPEPGAPNFHGSDGQIPNLYQQPAYVVPGFVYNDSPVYNGDIVNRSPRHHTTENLCSNENNSKSNDDTSTVNEPMIKDKKDSIGDSKKEMKNSEERLEEESKSQNPSNGIKSLEPSPVEAKTFSQSVSSALNLCNIVEFKPKSTLVEAIPKGIPQQLPHPEEGLKEEKRVEKQSHSTQTTSIEPEEKIIFQRLEPTYKESHSTQTLPEQSFPGNNRVDAKIQRENEKNDRIVNGTEKEPLTHPIRNVFEGKANWKSNQQQQQQQHTMQQNRVNREFQQNSSPKKYQEESPRKIYQKRTNFCEERKLKTESPERVEHKSADTSPAKVSYAKKAMAGLDAMNDKNAKVVNGVTPTTFNNRIPNGLKNAQNTFINGTNQPSVTNGINRINYSKPIPPSSDRHVNVFDDRKSYNGNPKNGFVKPRYNKYYSKNTSSHERDNSKDIRCRDKKMQLKSFDPGSAKSYEVHKDKLEEATSDSASPSEKSSTVSELSSPTELSSGQNTPPEKLIVRTMEQKIANEINKSFEEKLKQNLTKKNETGLEKDKEPDAEKLGEEEKKETSHCSDQVLEKGKIKGDGKKKCNSTNSKGKAETLEKVKDGNKTSGKKKKKKSMEETKEKQETETLNAENSFLPNLILQEPQDLIFRSWEGMEGEEADLISKMDNIIADDENLLKTLGLNEDKMNFSKLPLHSDLLMMLPAFGWSRPKFKIEDIFAPAKHLHNDLFTRRNITSMKSTKPEEFFASVIDSPVVEKVDKGKKGGNSKNPKKDQAQGKVAESGTEKVQEIKSVANSGLLAASNKKIVNAPKMNNKTNKNGSKNKNNKEEEKEKKLDGETKDKKYGIVEAVSTWLQEQENSEKVLSVDSIVVPKYGETEENGDGIVSEALAKVEAETNESHQKNGKGNPMHALSGKKEPEMALTAADFRCVNGCIRVANVINDSFIRINQDLYPRGKKPEKSRKPRSSSLDGKVSQTKIKKHLKFLTDSASFCQDLISDVRNGLPTKAGYATEELCDPKQSVLKYYTLSPPQRQNGSAFKGRHDGDDSENEAFDALEYQFLPRERKKVAGSTAATRRVARLSGNAAVPDSGAHSDSDSTGDASDDPQKNAPCKLQ